jgi:serine/threonine-protein kinase
MLAPSGHVTLIDFGFAHRLSSTTADWIMDLPLTGTLSYLAPELLTSKLHADVRSDLYSLGIMLYEMLTGRVPFSASDPCELARKHREETPHELRLFAPRLPLRLVRLMQSLLAKQPLRRPGSAAEVVKRLTALEIETFADRGPDDEGAICDHASPLHSA